MHSALILIGFLIPTVVVGNVVGPLETDECKDFSKDCGEMYPQVCQSDSAHFCNKTCGKCGDQPGGTCTDFSKDCAEMHPQVCQTQSAEFCKATCNQCDNKQATEAKSHN
ncbi:hypothetical protein M3Y94_00947900 [Aphelenchoides besseyi]|nr:hypothetical protein M3Y94_00947900 [Aphelenchoides besseyi]